MSRFSLLNPRRILLRGHALQLAARGDRERLAGHYREAERLTRQALMLARRSTAPDDLLRVRLLNMLGMNRASAPHAAISPPCSGISPPVCTPVDGTSTPCSSARAGWR